MDSKLITIGKTPRRAYSAYENFIGSEGVPVIGGYGVESVAAISMMPWARLGCDGAYLRFFGSDGVIGIYAGRIASGAGTQPERHLYEKIIYILQGEGIAEIQQRDRVPQNIVWRAGSLLSPPLNTLHRLMNQSDRPALFLAVTTAPLALDHYRSSQFVFHSDFTFSDRYDGDADYFASPQGHRGASRREWIHRANFVADVTEAHRGVERGKGHRIKITRFEMANNSLVGQWVEWPVGRYRKARCRSGGVALLILQSSGYSLMWPSHLGPQPYTDGAAAQVVRLDWAPGSLFCPPPNWFQQHFNTGAEPAQTLAFFCGSARFPMSRHADGANAARSLSGRSLVDFSGDDPSIRRMYEAELAQKGIPLAGS